jgi:hypothetical protein
MTMFEAQVRRGCVVGPRPGNTQGQNDSEFLEMSFLVETADGLYSVRTRDLDGPILLLPAYDPQKYPWQQ